MKILRFALVLMTVVSTALSSGAHDVVEAAEGEVAARENDWSVDFAPYAWAANINGTTTPGGVGIVDLLTHLNGMAMVDLFAHYKRIGLIADGAWVGVDFDDALSGPFFTNAHVDLGMAFGTVAMSWQFRPKPGLSLDPYVGGRWWRMHPSLALSGGLLSPRSVDIVETWADPVFGLRVSYDITDKWRAKFTGDVGGGVSKVTWQGYIAGEYAFNDWFALEIGHRSIGIDRNTGPLPVDVIIHGLQFGFHFTL